MTYNQYLQTKAMAQNKVYSPDKGYYYPMSLKVRRKRSDEVEVEQFMISEMFHFDSERRGQ